MENISSRKDEIIKAAENRFFRQGFKKTTLEDIANDIGIVKSALYKHFTNKEDLFSAVFDKLAQELMGLLEQRVSKAETSLEKIKILLMSMIGLISEKIKEYNASWELWYELKPFIIQSTNRHHQSFEMIVNKIADEGIKNGEIRKIPERMLFHFVDLSMENIEERLMLKKMSTEEVKKYIDFIFELLKHGIAVKSQN